MLIAANGDGTAAVREAFSGASTRSTRRPSTKSGSAAACVSCWPANPRKSAASCGPSRRQGRSRPTSAFTGGPPWRYRRRRHVRPGLLPRDYIHPIKIDLPGGKTLLATGRVVRTDESGGGVGIQFLLLEDESREALQRFISDSQIEKDLDDLRANIPPPPRRHRRLRRQGPHRRSHRGGRAAKDEFTVIEAGQKIPSLLRPLTSRPGIACAWRGESRRQAEDVGQRLRLLPVRLRHL